MAQSPTRRTFLSILAAAPFVGVVEGVAAPASVPASIRRLIAEARAVPEAQASVAERIDFISRALLGARYRADTLIGGPRQPERLVIRDDAFDCVTFCEFVLAAAVAHNGGEFEAALRAIRYVRGDVRWDERNHYFADWCRHAVEKQFCAPVALPNRLTIAKTVNWGNLGRRQVAIDAVAPATVLANAALLSNGDVIGFVSQRPNLDFFHTGLLIVGDDGELILRNASQTGGRVMDIPLRRFVAAQNVQQVTLLRPIERTAVAGGA